MSAPHVSTPMPAESAPPRKGGAVRVMFSALGWGGGMAVMRMACSFISIKVTAVTLGPAGLILVAQLSNFVSLLQSMLGQGVVTGVICLDAEYGGDATRRRRVRSTAAWMLLVLALVFGLAMAAFASPLSQWLLKDNAYVAVIAVAGLAVAAAMITDLLNGTLSATKEIGLIGTATMVSTVLGLVIFAPCAYFWGIQGALWGLFAVVMASALVLVAAVGLRSQGIKLADYFGSFDRTECRKLLGFYPMLLINGALAPLALILVRDALIAHVGLDAAGMWQATWRLSEAYQAVIISSTALYFMPDLGERKNDPVALRKQVLRTLAMTTASTALLALLIAVLREPIVNIIFSERFHSVATLLPLQLVGDVLKMAGWIFAMTLVATMRQRRFIAVAVLSMLTFVGLTHVLVPTLGVEGATWAYIITGTMQVVAGMLCMHDILWPGVLGHSAGPSGKPSP